MNRYRQTMTFIIDVWAETEDDATDFASDVFFYMAHEWHPVTTVLDDDDESFCPVNEPDEVTE